jgi:hypothetical protein
LTRLIIILIGLLNFGLVKGQTYSSITSDKEIYGFLNWMTINDRKYIEEPKLKQKQVYFKILSWDTANFVLKDTALINRYPHFNTDGQYLYQPQDETDTIFKQKDREFLFSQFIAIQDTIWHNKFSKSKLLTTKKQRRPNRYYYSIPLFSHDKKYVVIRRQYYCGDLCAHSGYYVYRRIEDNKWIFVTAVNTWIS